MNKDRLIVITGAGGRIGRSLIDRIIERTSWRIVAFSSSLMRDSIKSRRVSIHSNDDIKLLLPSLQCVDTCIHLAFSRRFNTNSEIALSLNFSADLYKAALSCGCRVINLSTVGVYGLNPHFPDETAIPSPDSLYSMAKYASEVLMCSVFKESKTDVSNVRLSGIAQSQRVLPIFIENAKTEGEIHIRGGKQQFSWIDILDATDALIALIAYDGKWRHSYNVSLNEKRYMITELAEKVAAVAEKKGYAKTVITIAPSEETPICVGWNSDAFSMDTGWRPCVSIDETIDSMFKE